MAKKHPRNPETEPVQPDPDPEQPLGQDPDPAAEPPKTDEPEPGPLSKLQAALQELLDYDQITEVRLALYSREAELEKHTKKGSDLGVREEDARRRLRVIRGSEERFGLVMIFAPVEATEQRDVFYDREKPSGRPKSDAEVDQAVHDHVLEQDQLEAESAALAGAGAEA